MKKLFLSIVLAIASACGDVGETNGALENGDDVAVVEQELGNALTAVPSGANTVTVTQSKTATTGRFSLKSRYPQCPAPYIRNGQLVVPKCSIPYTYVFEQDTDIGANIQLYFDLSRPFPAGSTGSLCLYFRNRQTGAVTSAGCTSISNQLTFSGPRNFNAFPGSTHSFALVAPNPAFTLVNPPKYIGDPEFELQFYSSDRSLLTQGAITVSNITVTVLNSKRYLQQVQ